MQIVGIILFPACVCAGRVAAAAHIKKRVEVAPSAANNCRDLLLRFPKIFFPALHRE